MIHQIAYWDREAGEQRVRDATPEEVAEIDARASDPAPPTPRHITEFAFRNRFTTAEKLAIEMASLDDPTNDIVQRQHAAVLRVYLADLRAAAFIDLDMPTTRAGVQDIEVMGIIGGGRAAQILDAEVLPEERPL